MRNVVLAGRPVAQAMREKLTDKVKKAGRDITLAVVLVGGDHASHVYKDRLFVLAADMGIKTAAHFLPASAGTKQVVSLLETLNEDNRIDGILPMLPLPGHIDSGRVSRAVAPSKDVDCLNYLNTGLFYMGKSLWAPCTPRAVMATLRHYGIMPAGRHAVVVGRSNIVGKPLANLLLSADATVTVCHSKTENLPLITRQADILLTAVGRAGFIQADMLKEGAVLVDVGINLTPDGIAGDAAPDACARAGAYTPVPGGIGTVSAMMVMETLLHNTEERDRG